MLSSSFRYLKPGVVVWLVLFLFYQPVFFGWNAALRVLGCFCNLEICPLHFEVLFMVKPPKIRNVSGPFIFEWIPPPTAPNHLGPMHLLIRRKLIIVADFFPLFFSPQYSDREVSLRPAVVSQFHFSEAAFCIFLEVLEARLRIHFHIHRNTHRHTNSRYGLNSYTWTCSLLFKTHLISTLSLLLFRGQTAFCHILQRPGLLWWECPPTLQSI